MKFVPLGAQTSFFGGVGLEHGLVQSLEAFVFAGASLDFTGKDYCCSGGTADDRGIGSFQRGDLKLLV